MALELNVNAVRMNCVVPLSPTVSESRDLSPTFSHQLNQVGAKQRKMTYSGQFFQPNTFPQGLCGLIFAIFQQKTAFYVDFIGVIFCSQTKRCLPNFYKE
jgi:hypothetical protein